MRISWSKAPLKDSALAAQFPELWRFASDDQTAVRYDPKFREFTIPVLNGGGGKSGIVISFDPWTGKQLPSPLRHQWIDQIEALRFEPSLNAWYDKSLPAEFRTEQWWLERGL